MKLSELIYKIVTSVTYFEQNNSITPLELRKYAYYLSSNSNEGTVTIDSDYKRNIDNVFSVLNEAIQRVATLEKLPLKNVKFSSDENGLIDLTYIEDLDHIINVYVENGKSFKSLKFENVGINKIQIEVKNTEVNIEYYPEIKFFGFNDIAYHYDDFMETETDRDVELREIGISNKTASYLALYAEGKLGHDIYGAEANQKINQAESYFADLDDYAGMTIHYQNEIDRVYKV